MPFSLQKNLKQDKTIPNEKLLSPKQKRKQDAYELALLTYDMFKRKQLNAALNNKQLVDDLVSSQGVEDD